MKHEKVIAKTHHHHRQFRRILAMTPTGFHSSCHHLPFLTIYSHQGSRFAVDRALEDSRLFELDFGIITARGSSPLVPLNLSRPKVSNPSFPTIVGWLAVTVEWRGHFNNLNSKGNFVIFDFMIILVISKIRIG